MKKERGKKWKVKRCIAVHKMLGNMGSVTQTCISMMTIAPDKMLFFNHNLLVLFWVQLFKALLA